MQFAVRLTDGAAGDLQDLSDYIAGARGVGEARQVLDRIKQVLPSLGETPNRGTYPKEFLDLGIREFREAFFKPYRIVYQVAESDVHVLLITDGRRDLRTLLQRRLLSP
jgi:toxin ParE1/3/4